MLGVVFPEEYGGAGLREKAAVRRGLSIHTDLIGWDEADRGAIGCLLCIVRGQI